MLNVGRQVRESGGFIPGRSLSESEIVIVQRDNFALLGCGIRVHQPDKVHPHGYYARIHLILSHYTIKPLVTALR